jgi:hypothetical protein
VDKDVQRLFNQTFDYKNQIRFVQESISTTLEEIAACKTELEGVEAKGNHLDFELKKCIVDEFHD